MNSRRFQILLPVAIALPGVVVALVTGLSGVSVFVTDRPLILAPVPRTVAEAAGNRDVADVVVMSAWSDMNLPAPARIPLRLHEPAMLTPLEAAVVSERAYMIGSCAIAARVSTQRCCGRCAASRRRGRIAGRSRTLRGSIRSAEL